MLIRFTDTDNDDIYVNTRQVATVHPADSSTAARPRSVIETIEDSYVVNGPADKVARAINAVDALQPPAKGGMALFTDVDGHRLALRDDQVSSVLDCGEHVEVHTADEGEYLVDDTFAHVLALLGAEDAPA